MSDQTTFAGITSITSSPASEDGLTPFVLPDGRTISASGLAAALASLSARRVKELGLRTSGIYGPPGSISSRSADLQSSLESRLRARLSGLGSTLYKLTWKEWATPSGVSRLRQRGSAHRTSVTELTGWPTPMAGTPAQNGNNPAGNNDSSRKTVALCGWPTPTAALANNGVRSTEGGIREAMRNHGPDLAAMSCLTLGSPARFTASGEMLTGSSAEMESGGQLRPAHSRWLMGYPMAWDTCGIASLKKSKRS